MPVSDKQTVYDLVHHFRDTGGVHTDPKVAAISPYIFMMIIYT